jgi:N-acetylmuramoyl-L-alanine amidase
MGWLAAIVKDVDLALELHFNSADSPDAHGHEFLYCEGSSRGHAFAVTLEAAFADHYPWSRNRGAKPISKHENGHGFLCGIKPVAVICEPFFGSNPDEWDEMDYPKGTFELAKAYFDGIERYSEKLA